MKFSSSKKYLKYGCTFVSIIRACRTNPLCTNLKKKCFLHAACLDFLCNFCLVLLQTKKTSLKYELGRSSGNVFFFLFYPNLNTRDALHQYRLSRKSDHWGRHMTRQIVSFRNFANAPERKAMSDVTASVPTVMRPKHYK